MVTRRLPTPALVSGSIPRVPADWSQKDLIKADFWYNVNSYPIDRSNKMTSNIRRRSITSDPVELVVPCKQEGCNRRFLSNSGLSIHMWRTHGISTKPEKKVPEGETVCSNCKKDFGTHRKLVSHGSAEVCAKRKAAGWKVFTCQNTTCAKEYEKYIGSKGNNKGQKYCSMKCSSEAVSFLPILNKKCAKCSIDFTTKTPKQIYCSKECSKYHHKGRKKKDSSNMGGPRPGGGYSKQLPYTSRFGEEMKLNREEIWMAEYLDSTEYTWSRNWKGFEYTTKDGKSRKFYPDFYVEELDLYVEYKGFINDVMDHKVKDAQANNSDLKLLIVVGISKRYLHMGTPIKDLQDGKRTLLS